MVSNLKPNWLADLLTKGFTSVGLSLDEMLYKTPQVRLLLRSLRRWFVGIFMLDLRVKQHQLVRDCCFGKKSLGDFTTLRYKPSSRGCFEVMG